MAGNGEDGRTLNEGDEMNQEIKEKIENILELQNMISFFSSVLSEANEDESGQSLTGTPAPRSLDYYEKSQYFKAISVMARELDRETRWLMEHATKSNCSCNPRLHGVCANNGTM